MWIVAHQTRAIDDGTARQLQMDGGYDRVTFVTTRSDDLSSREVLRSIPSLKEDLEPLEEEVDALLLEKKEAGKAVKAAKEKHKALVFEVE